MGVWNQVGIGLPYRPAWPHSLAELVPWNRFFTNSGSGHLELLIDNRHRVLLVKGIQTSILEESHIYINVVLFVQPSLPLSQLFFSPPSL
jgi:hypothetical protein